MNIRHALVALLLLATLLAPPLAPAEPRDGGRNEYGAFLYSPPDQFIALTHPVYVPAKKAKLANDARVVGLKIGDETRCYPVRQMWFHHVVNDSAEGVDYALTYCVMADTAVTYLRDSPQWTLHVGGLFGGVLALREQGSDTMWPQIAPVPIPDNPTTRTLRLGPPPVLTTFGLWKKKYPATQVLAPVATFEIKYEAYDQKPKGYNVNPLLNETVVRNDARLAPGAEIFGAARNGESVAWTTETLRVRKRIETTLGGAALAVRWDESLQSPVLDGPFDGISMQAYWYAWSEFYPQTRLETAAASSKDNKP